MNIKGKLLIGFTISIVVTVLACLSIYNQLKIVETRFEQTLETSLPQTYATAELNRLAMEQATLVQSYIMGNDTQQAIQSHQDEVVRYITELEQTVSKDKAEAQSLLVSIRDKLVVMNAGFDEAIAMKNTQGQEVASKYYIDVAGMNVVSFMEDATGLSAQVAETFDEARNDASGKADQALIATIVSIVVAIAAGVATALSLTKRIANPLRKLEGYVQEISKGNLAVTPVQINSKDELGSLSHEMNEMRDNIRMLLQNLTDNANDLNQSSEQLLQSSNEVNESATMMLSGAKGGAESASAMAISANESAIAINETAVAVQKIAESTQEVHIFASQTEHTAIAGKSNVAKASTQMNAIYDSTKITTELIHTLSQQSREIESITQVITAIADQTNLLALNASIEAARAGEHGKGFAVVAAEVRKLAEESNQSASKIVTLTNAIQHGTKNVETAIQSSLTNVEQGVEIIDFAGRSFEEIVSAIGHIKEQIEDVSAATEEISATAEEVAASVTQISKASDLTYDSAKQAYEASEAQLETLQGVAGIANTLGDRAQQLQQVVAAYKL
ncbi:methyl-accepting chemotaxis protein [Solibacillus sp.]|uniref:methyl-accepting chemotaxis protein n=1 Tax=Solibacillus sp. TaxID=1909654 RepID=UPI003315875F